MQTPDVTDTICRLNDLPAEIYEAEVAVVKAQQDYDLDEALHDDNVALEKSKQFARAKIDKLTAQEVQAWTEYQTTDTRLITIRSKANLNKAKANLKHLENQFVAMRKISELIKLEYRLTPTQT